MTHASTHLSAGGSGSSPFSAHYSVLFWLFFSPPSCWNCWICIKSEAFIRSELLQYDLVVGEAAGRGERPCRSPKLAPFISGECQGSECSSAVSPPTAHCLSQPKICPQESLPISALRARHVPVRLHWAMRSWAFSPAPGEICTKFIPFHMQAPRHLELAVSAKSRFIIY